MLRKPELMGYLFYGLKQLRYYFVIFCATRLSFILDWICLQLAIHDNLIIEPIGVWS